MSFSRQRNGYLIQAPCGVCALFAFFFIPYFQTGRFYATAQRLAVGYPNSSYTFYNYANPGLWLLAIAALAITLVAGWYAYRSRKDLVTTMAAKFLIGIAALALLVMLVTYCSAVLQDLNEVPYHSFGFWTLVLALIGTIIGGIVVHQEE